ncbi:hypothetical protein D3C76_1565180 [compost metagenome]
MGSILQLAVALDRSETQPVQRLTAIARTSGIRLQLECNHNPGIEIRETGAIAKEFKKVWSLVPEIQTIPDFSTSLHS